MRQQRTRGNIIPATLAASALMSFLVGFSFLAINLNPEEMAASLELSPAAAVVNVGNTFTTSLELTANEPINAFTGQLSFDPEILQVEKIDYNLSIANLWAEEPWYKNGDGTIHFAGGTTQPGGFTGRGNILTVTFTTLAPGTGAVSIEDVQVLKHDGLGSEAPVAAPIDGLFTIVQEPANVSTLHGETAVTVRDPLLTADLNGDGVVSVTDISIFFVHLATGNKASDVNRDGRVSTSDLSILISQM